MCSQIIGDYLDDIIQRVCVYACACVLFSFILIIDFQIEPMTNASMLIALPYRARKRLTHFLLSRRR